MGAAGVWIGTRLVLSKEHQANIHSVNTVKFKAAESGNTGVTRSESGKKFRQIRPAWSEELLPNHYKVPYPDGLVGDLLGALEEHDIEPLIHSGAGQSVGYFDKARSVKIIMDGLVKEASAVLGTSGYLSKISVSKHIFSNKYANAPSLCEH